MDSDIYRLSIQLINQSFHLVFHLRLQMLFVKKYQDEVFPNYMQKMENILKQNNHSEGWFVGDDVSSTWLPTFFFFEQQKNICQSQELSLGASTKGTKLPR